MNERELIQTMPSSLTTVPENDPNEQADLVPQPVELVENSSQNFSEHSL